MIKNNIKKLSVFLSSILFSAISSAGQVTLQLPGDGGILDKIVIWFQKFIAFTSGPGAVIIAVILIVAGGGMMMLDPRATWLMLVFKVIGVLIIILNIGLIIAAFTFG